MLETPELLTRLASWRKAPAFVGLVALALLHVAAAAHLFEQSADHDIGVCAACGAYSQLEDTAAPCVASEGIVVTPYSAVDRPRATTFETPFSATYRSRAPPLS